MPKSGSQIILCDLPVRFDTYEGCGHACSYCFVSRKADIAKIKLGEGVESLARWIKGARDKSTNWCDWPIPLHWGGLSDPFQPAEKIHRRSLEALKLFAETGYPFVVSTKNKMIAEEPYYSLLKRCNCVVQFSSASPQYDRFERGASPYAERLAAAAKLSKICRVNFRVQPYVPGIFADVLRGIPKWAEAGVHGIILEGMKYSTPVIQGLVSVGNDYCYASEVLLPQFKAIRESAHKRGMKFYCGENRLRALSDELCCCGVEGMGWKVNTANLNHALFDRPGFQFTPKMEEKGTAMAFHAMEQTTLASKELPLCSYREKMEQRLASLPYPRICLDNGARVQIVAATGRTSAINAKAAEYVRNNGGYLLRYGFDMRGNADCFLQSVAQQVQNIPDNLDNLVVTIGSAITIVGILYGLALYGKRVRNIYGIGVAPNREEKIREYVGMLPHGVDLSALRYIDAFNTLRGFHYEDTFDIAYHGIRLHPRYEAKAFRWMLANKLGGGTLFWITGGELTKRTI